MPISTPNEPDIEAVAASVADASRARILGALLAGRALTAGELARVAAITPQTCSGHLAKLRDAGLVTEHRQGRHRYHLLAGAHIAAFLETLQAFAAMRTSAIATGPTDPALRHARVCYDHLAGSVGVQWFDMLRKRGWLQHSATELALSEEGHDQLAILQLPVISHQRPSHCRACLDWSERRMHLAGPLATDMLNGMLAQDWLRRSKHSRALLVTAQGEQEFRQRFGIVA